MTSLIHEDDLDGKEDIVLNLPREELFVLLLAAHERDITFNQLVEQILRDKLDELDSIPDKGSPEQSPEV
jgi:hypothetical protein